MLRSIEYYKITDRKQAQYIPILDTDCDKAAKALTKKDLKVAYQLLKDVFDEYREGKKVHDLLYDTVFYSWNNYIWFWSFMREMGKLLDIKEVWKFPGRINYGGKEPAPYVLQPFNIGGKDEEGFYSLRYNRLNAEDKSPINNYRLLYIVSGYEMSDFIGDIYPRWYVFNNTTLFEQYDERTNIRVRVDFVDDKLKYYIAGASDNWTEIENVPYDMKYVISALIFRQT